MALRINQVKEIVKKTRQSEKIKKEEGLIKEKLKNEQLHEEAKNKLKDQYMDKQRERYNIEEWLAYGKVSDYNNNGFDDDYNEYMVREGEHLCYRYEVVKKLG